jgi:ELWxxDGT repeat protein
MSSGRRTGPRPEQLSSKTSAPCTRLPPFDLTNVNGTLYFDGSDPQHGSELWKSDGTAAGTVMVKDIAHGEGGSGPSDLTNVDGKLYFAANDGKLGVELWKSNGTAAGTKMVKDIIPGSESSDPSDMTNVNGTLYFVANDGGGIGAHGRELWKTDGTAAGTVMVKNINPGPNDSSTGNLKNVDGTLYFRAHDATHGDELWKSDGTAAGTVMIKDINPDSGISSPHNLTAANGLLEFYASDGMSLGLFRSDGTADGTFELATSVDNTPPGVTATPARDFDGDSFSDILWQNTSSGQASIGDINGKPLSDGGPSAPIWVRLGKRLEPATSTATAFPTSYGKTRAAAKFRSGR